MEEDEAAQDPTRGRPEENDIGVRTRREAGEHAVDSRILGHVRPERDGNLPLAFQGPGQRGRGTVRRRQAAHGEFPSDPRLDDGGGARRRPPPRPHDDTSGWAPSAVELTITHIDFLRVWPRASPRPATLSPAGHATRSVRRAYHPSDDSGDRRDGLSTIPLARASAAPPLALCPTWPPRRRIRPHSATPWPARPAPAPPGPATPQSVLPRWCTSRPPLPNSPILLAVGPRYDSRFSASGDTLRSASGRDIAGPPPALPSASWRAPASTTPSAGPRLPARGVVPTPPPVSTSAARRGGISLDPGAASYVTPASPPWLSGQACRATAARGS